MFMELMSNTSSYGHCKNVLSSVKYIHTAAGYQFPSDSFNLEATLQGIKRRLKGTPQFVLPIDPIILRRMYAHIDITKPQDLSLWCSFLTAFYCLFRKANVVPRIKTLILTVFSLAVTSLLMMMAKMSSSMLTSVKSTNTRRVSM